MLVRIRSSLILTLNCNVDRSNLVVYPENIVVVDALRVRLLIRRSSQSSARVKIIWIFAKG